MKLGEIKDYIRSEAKVSDSGALDVLLGRRINEKIRGLTTRETYGILQTTTTLTPVDATSALALPADYQHFYSIHWNNYKLNRTKAFPNLALPVGTPYYFRIGKPNIYVFPYDDVVSTDVVDLVYYKLHTLSADDDDLLIDEMADYLITSIAAEIAAVSSSELASILAVGSRESYINLRSDELRNAGN